MRPADLLQHVIRPALAWMGPRYADPRAAVLLLATCAQESHCGEYLRQVGGPALGIMQIEPAAYKLVCDWHDRQGLKLIEYPRPDPERLVSDLRLSVVVARLLYYSWPDPLPASTVDATWPIYKRCYNSTAGKATPEQWRQNWARYVAPALGS